jgi:hypothetical protein
MLKSEDSKNNNEYEKRFVSLWGEGWKKDLEMQEKVQKQRMSVVS